MAKITYIEFDGTPHTVEVEERLSVMEGATRNRIPGIDADCGGQCACGTCQVYLEPEWFAVAGPRTALEEAMLEVVPRVQARSRLSCQIKVTKALDGLVLRMPPSQH